MVNQVYPNKNKGFKEKNKKNPPSNAGAMSSTPGEVKSHMTGQLSQRTLQPMCSLEELMQQLKRRAMQPNKYIKSL